MIKLAISHKTLTDSKEATERIVEKIQEGYIIVNTIKTSDRKYLISLTKDPVLSGLMLKDIFLKKHKSSYQLIWTDKIVPVTANQAIELYKKITVLTNNNVEVILGKYVTSAIKNEINKNHNQYV
jgi:hypothetical protein